MESAAVRVSSPPAPLFEDGLGARHQVLDHTTNERLEALSLRCELTANPSFEAALRERVSRLSGLGHGVYARVRRLEHPPAGPSLIVVAESAPGVRLSEILTLVGQRQLTLDVSAALGLIRQVMSAVAILHETARDAAHGAIGPERIVVTSHARVVLTDYVFGSALEQLHYSPERYWKELRIAVPRSAGLPRFDHRTDVTQIGVVALSLILGRLLQTDEYPARVADVVSSAVSARGEAEPVTAALRTWLTRTLQINLRNAFTSVPEALGAFDDMLSQNGAYAAAPAALEAFLVRYQAHTADPRLKPVPAAQMPVRLQHAPRPIQPASALSDIVPLGASSAELGRSATPRVAAARQYAPREAAEIEPDEGSMVDGLLHFAFTAIVMLAIVGAGIFVLASYYGGGAPFGARRVGTVVVESTPPGVQVVVDGEGRGTTPISLTLRAGEHVLELHGEGEPHVIPVTVQAGAEISQHVDLSPAPPARSRAGATPPTARPAGDGTQSTLAVNASPWAEVWVDGEHVGETPLGNLPVSVGPHEVVFRHPVLGERRHEITVTSSEPARLSVDFSTP